jgi:hypothetical protein
MEVTIKEVYEFLASRTIQGAEKPLVITTEAIARDPVIRRNFLNIVRFLLPPTDAPFPHADVFEYRVLSSLENLRKQGKLVRSREIGQHHRQNR